ncbi:MAG: GNAT family N-acetyltransferase [Ruminococcus sp.]|uniref:GNAT family N-acetyltransferase n=1 Tax=Ruminococcus sp. TaxID=41978 RepID=UPI002872FAFC|nr:GNAT family protein [Ruminococcus sp.]MBQ3285539.1 GNAT family N-acetyltransferase [Ruminococcus sp.]
MRLRLRQYKSCDADSIVSWIKDEDALRKWSSDRFGDFPITPEDINNKYLENNGDCIECDNFYPLTAFDENGIVGHLILRYTDEEKKVIRFGFVIVDDAKRGKGYGKEMLTLAIKYAFDIFGAEKITLGVFDNNKPAYCCYKAAGFKETGEEIICEFFGKHWRQVEMEIKR